MAPISEDPILIIFFCKINVRKTGVQEQSTKIEDPGDY